MNIGEIISVVTLLFGAVLGLSAMFSPAWASRIVRLVEDPDPLRPGGYSEFRATYGGLFLFAHLMTAILVVNLSTGSEDILTTLVVLPLALRARESVPWRPPRVACARVHGLAEESRLFVVCLFAFVCT